MTPLAIYQRALDTVSAAVLAGDFSAYIAMIDLPYLLRLTDADLVLTSADEARAIFRTLSQGLAQRGVTHYERLAREAQFQRPDRIVGWHFTHMIASGERIQPPHAASAALVRRESGAWRFTEASYPLSSAAWPLDPSVIFGHALTRGAEMRRPA